jgi:hypothetical protein
MVERLGDVLYALGCIAGGAVLALWLLIVWQAPDMRGIPVFIFAAVIAISLWLIGRHADIFSRAVFRWGQWRAPPLAIRWSHYA